MFEDATFHSSNILPSQTPKWMLLTCAANLTVVTALIVLPLVCPHALPTLLVQRILYTPPQQPVPLMEPRRIHVATQTAPQTFNLSLPPRIPSADPLSAPPENIPGIPGTSSLPGIPGAVDTPVVIFREPMRTVVKAAPTGPINVSTGVSEGMILSKTNPTYPIIARSAGISGTIVLAATISTTGRIEHLQVLSGPLMLRQAAIDAVKTWRYRPYLLNNQPVEVETTINIAFTLGNR